MTKRKQQIEINETVWVEKTGTVGKRRVFHEEKEDTIAVHTFVTEPSVFGLRKEVRINLGDYEGVWVDVSLRRPCYVEEEADTISAVKKRVDEILQEEVDDLVKIMRER